MIPFVKMQGIGNDFVVLDALRGDLPPFDPVSLSKTLCDRRRGIGGDGLLVMERGDEAPFRMRMWNPDGSESEMCGNGLRCVAALLRDRNYVSDQADIETGAGVLHAGYVGDLVSIDMGVARLERGAIGMTGDPAAVFVESDLGDGTLATAVSMGNPHLVLFVDDVDAISLEPRGRELEVHPFFPQRTNVHFSQVLSPDEVKVRVWERGAGATLACGTGACAVAVAGVETGRLSRRSTVHLPGGPLTIEVAEDRRVTMTGPAVTVFDGVFG
jgi:diaminopimelate epimerase